MKYSRALTMTVILNYLFTSSELSTPLGINMKVNIYDDLENYITWASKRVEILFFQMSSANDWSIQQKIKEIDNKLLTIFPFLKRLVDRSIFLEKALAYLELFERNEEEFQTPPNSPRIEVVETPPNSPHIEVAEPPPNKPNIEVAEPPPNKPNIKVTTTPPIEQKMEPLSKPIKAPQPSQDSSAAQKRKKAAPKPREVKMISPEEIIPEGGIHWKGVTVTALRKALDEAGFPRAFILNKQQAIAKAILYNTELKEKALRTNESD